MSAIQEEIKQQLGAFAGKFGPQVIEPATVTAVNDDNTVQVQLSDGSTVDDVRLKSVVKAGDRVVMIPAINSVVLIGSIENSKEYVVLAVDEVSEVIYNIMGVTYSVTGDGFLFKKNEDTLKDVMIDLIEAVEQIIVLKGRNPDRVKLALAKNKVNNILR